MLDVALALTAIVVLAPIMVVVALIVALNDGLPVIYRQKRTGIGLEPFSIAKFRTMIRNASYTTGAFKRSDPDWCERPVRLQTADPRIIRAGGFLRKYSLDELPQLWNVLRGEMSIVGPRPLLLSQVEDATGTRAAQIARRSAVRPGITGLWQVSGRSEITFDEMLALDVQYVSKMSLLGDLAIVFRTVRVVIRGAGAT